MVTPPHGYQNPTMLKFLIENGVAYLEPMNNLP